MKAILLKNLNKGLKTRRQKRAWKRHLKMVRRQG